MSEAAHKPKRQRSPSYPGVNLETAIERARTLYAEEGRALAPVDAVLGHWGYKPGVGPGLVTFAALKKFGLLADEGSGANRKGRLAPLALQIILDDRDHSPEREKAIQTAALNPSIHQELWDRFGPDLPSDATMRHFLRFDRNFTDKAADELIREFRETVAFARLNGSDSLSPSEGDYSQQATESRASMSAAVASPRVAGSGPSTSVQLPLSANEWVTLNGAFPLTETAWQQLLRVLDVMKPGLVQTDAEHLPPEDGQQ